MIELDKKRAWRGVFPVIKSFLYGNNYIDESVKGEAPIYTQSFWQIITGSHSFNKEALKYLIWTGYENNPDGFGVISKICLSQRNIIFQPYWKGKPYLSKTIDFDLNDGLYNLVTAGTCVIWKKDVVGFGYKHEVLTTVRLEEEYSPRTRTFKYWYELGDGSKIQIPETDLIFIPWQRTGSTCTRMGVSPLQASLMPIESLKHMYIADTSIVKNKGVDVLITNDSDIPIVEQESGEMDKVLNDRIGGSHRQGKIATSTAKLRAIQLGRSIKELALWDGYKIKLRSLCNALQVDSGLFNDPDNKTYSNRQEAIRSLYNECVLPLTKIITDNKQLIQSIGFEIYCDTSNIEALQESQATKAEKAKSAIETITSINSSIKNGTITREIGLQMLVMEAGYTEEEAGKLLIQNPSNQYQSSDNNQNLVNP